VSPVKYELVFYIPEDGILHSHRRENLKSYIGLTGWALWRRRDASPVKYELGLYIPEDDIAHSHRRKDLKSCIPLFILFNALIVAFHEDKLIIISVSDLHLYSSCQLLIHLTTLLCKCRTLPSIYVIPVEYEIKFRDSIKRLPLLHESATVHAL
jgi:hypothetical protein